MEQKAFFIRLAKEFDIYDVIFNRKYDYLETYIKSPYINNIVSRFYSIATVKKKVKCNDKIVKVNDSLLYNFLPFSPQRIIIKNVENREKILKYLDENGVVWASFGRLIGDYSRTSFNEEGTVHFCISNGLLSWGRTDFWRDSTYKDIFFTEDEFYKYWDDLMLKIKNHFNEIIKINLYDNNNNIRKS